MHRICHACTAPHLPRRGISGCAFSLIPPALTCPTVSDERALRRPAHESIRHRDHRQQRRARRSLAQAGSKCCMRRPMIRMRRFMMTRPRKSSASRAAPSRARRISASSRRCASASGARHWFETGCLSAHYRNPVFEGEEVQATVEMPKPGQHICAIGMTRKDGTEILRGTASVGRDVTDTALSLRLKELKPLTDPVILKDIKVGMKTTRQTVTMDVRPAYGRSLSLLAVPGSSRSLPSRRHGTRAMTIHGAGRSCRSRC